MCLLLMWVLIFIVFCFVVGNDCLMEIKFLMCLGIFKWIKFVEVKIIVLYLLLFNLFKCVFMLLRNDFIVKCGYFVIN